MANPGLELCRRHTSEGDGDRFGRKQSRPFLHIGALTLRSTQCTVTRQRCTWAVGRHVRGPLLGSDEVLDIPLGHDRRLSRSGTSIEGNMTVKVQTKALAVVELDHQKSPPE